MRDDVLAARLLVQLGEARRRYRANGVPVPAWIEAVFVTLIATSEARSGLERPELAESGADPDPLLVDLDEAAARLRVGPRTVRRLVETGALPSVRIGRARRVRVADLEAYVEGLAP